MPRNDFDKRKLDPQVQDLAESLYNKSLLDNPHFPQIPWLNRPDFVRDAWLKAAISKIVPAQGLTQ